jgi:hypothetical protein
MTWSRAMGLAAARLVVRFIRTQTRSHTVVDPFCGHGTALAAANEAGLHAVGVELGAKRARRARRLDLAHGEARNGAGDDDGLPDGLRARERAAHRFA